MNQMSKMGMTTLIAATTLWSACKKDPVIQQYALNTEASTATWKGYQRTGYFNEGTINVQSTSLEVKNGKVSAGSFEMPLSSLKNLNLPTDSLKGALIHHLKTADFFNMTLYPNLSFNIKSVKGYTGGTPGAVAGANYTIEGSFTMLGKAIDISFPAKIDISNKQLVLDANLKIDRTRWGMKYGAADTLPDDKHIKPEVDIHLQLSGKQI